MQEWPDENDRALFDTIEDASWWIANRGPNGTGIRKSFKQPDTKQLSLAAQAKRHAQAQVRQPEMAAIQAGLANHAALAENTPDSDGDLGDGGVDGDKEAEATLPPPSSRPDEPSTMQTFREARETSVKLLKTMSMVREFAASVSRHPAMAELAITALMAQLYAGKNEEVRKRLLRDADKLRADLRDKLIKDMDVDFDGIDRILRTGRNPADT